MTHLVCDWCSRRALWTPEFSFGEETTLTYPPGWRCYYLDDGVRHFCGTVCLDEFVTHHSKAVERYEARSDAAKQADAIGLTVPGVNKPCHHGIEPGECAECDGGSSPEPENKQG